MRIAVYYLQTEVVTMIYRPLYVDKIMAYVDTPFVKILTGVRRCGKSTILKMIMERLKTQRNIPDECIVSCRYDSMEYEDISAKSTLLQYGKMKSSMCRSHRSFVLRKRKNGSMSVCWRSTTTTPNMFWQGMSSQAETMRASRRCT